MTTGGQDRITWLDPAIMNSQKTKEYIVHALSHELGNGSIGTTYEFKDDPRVAIKEISVDNQDQETLDTFINSMNILIKLSGPYLVPHYNYFQYDKRIYVIMKRYHSSLGSYIRQLKRSSKVLSIDVILCLFQKIVAGLRYLHNPDKGNNLPVIVHGRLNMMNILISEDLKECVISDAGYSNSAKTKDVMLIHPQPHFSPEVILGHKPTAESDMWSLGIILYEMTTGIRPLFFKDKELTEDFLSDWRPNLSVITDSTIKFILENLLVVNPRNRISAACLYEMINSQDVKSSMQVRLLEMALASEREESKRARERYKALEAVIVDLRQQLVDQNQSIKRNNGSVNHAAANYSAVNNRVAGARVENTTDIVNAEILKTEINDLKQKNASMRRILGKRCRDEDLITAIDDNNTELALVLINASIGVGKEDKDGISALIHAVIKAQTEVVIALAKHEGEHGKRDKCSRTALMLAACHGYIDMIPALAQYEAKLKDREGKTALMWAVLKNQPGVVEALVAYEKGEVDNRGWSALMWSAHGNIDKAVSVLVDHEKGLRNKEGKTALLLAAEAGHTQVVKMLAPHELEASGWTKLIYSAYTGDINLARQNLSEAKKPDDHNWTALMWSAQKGHDELVRLLIGYEKGLTNSHSQTALMLAASQGNSNIGRMLVQHEGGMQDMHGETALMKAALEGYAPVVNILLEKEVTIKSWNGETALMHAARRGHCDVVNILAEREKGMKNNGGQTALKIAAASGRQAVVDCLSKYPEEQE